ISSMYQTRQNNENDEVLNSSRFMFVLVGMGLIGLTAWWGWRLAGVAGAVVPAVLLAFDPNFLAHAGLVKNDVPLTLLMLCLGYATWQFGREQHRFKWLGSVWAGLTLLVVAAAVNTKYSGLLFGPMLALMLLMRAVLPASAGGGRWRIG